ncbi:MAG: polyisoprenoid-binding protein [Alphaproteobacteria bacterium]|nr:polyisoprenoid-binding protein [Alphaproteobacteria bacterium]
MKRLLTSALSILVMGLSLGLPGTAHAQIETYSFDKAHTQILFFVNHLGFSNSQGEFLDFDGTFTFDRGEPEKSSVDVTIQTNSIDMDDEKWDTHMKSADFFNVEHFPTMHFKSTSIVLTGEDTADITGDMTILGVTKPVTLSTKLNKAGPHPFGSKYMAGLSASAHIKRSDFGMNYGLPMVGDDVEIRIEVEGVRDDSAAQGVENP